MGPLRLFDANLAHLHTVSDLGTHSVATNDSKFVCYDSPVRLKRFSAYVARHFVYSIYYKKGAYENTEKTNPRAVRLPRQHLPIAYG